MERREREGGVEGWEKPPWPLEFGGGGTSSKMDKGRFSDMSSDPRHTMATHRHNDQKRTSFDPASMNCYTCANHHPIQEGGGD